VVRNFERKVDESEGIEEILRNLREFEGFEGGFEGVMVREMEGLLWLYREKGKSLNGEE